MNAVNDLLRYAFEDVCHRQLRNAFVGATEVATDRSGVVGFRKVAWCEKFNLTPIFLQLCRRRYFVLNSDGARNAPGLLGAFSRCSTAYCLKVPRIVRSAKN